jgi:hypothetical protein
MTAPIDIRPQIDDRHLIARDGTPAGAPLAGQIPELHELIDWSRSTGSRMGYFAVLYLHVGHAVDRALAAGKFQHPDALRRLSAAFFLRYRMAFDDFRAGRAATAPWEASFKAADDNDLCVLEHLMLGVNAHINFDLAIAVADSIPPAQLAEFRADFEYMNTILGTLVDGMAADLATVFAPLRIINKLFRREDDLVVDFSMRVAREKSWQHVLSLSALAGPEREQAITLLERQATALATLVMQRRSPTRWLMSAIRDDEHGTVAQIIDDLLER